MLKEMGLNNSVRRRGGRMVVTTYVRKMNDYILSVLIWFGTSEQGEGDHTANFLDPHNRSITRML